MAVKLCYLSFFPTFSLCYLNKDAKGGPPPSKGGHPPQFKRTPLPHQDLDLLGDVVRLLVKADVEERILLRWELSFTATLRHCAVNRSGVVESTPQCISSSRCRFERGPFRRDVTGRRFLKKRQRRGDEENSRKILGKFSPAATSGEI